MTKAAVFLFDLTGVMAEPWAEAGYDCYCFDIQHPEGITQDPIYDNIYLIGGDISKGVTLPAGVKERVAFAAAFPPCDHLSVSGARWFKGKGLRKLAWSIELFATAAEFCEELDVPYLIENPVSTISTYWRKPDHTFHPHQWTNLCPNDNYTKKTCLWVGGGFVMPPPDKDESLPAPDDRIHKCAPSENRANIRSATPEGFAKAVFKYNHK